MRRDDDSLDLLGCAMAAIIATLAGCWLIAQTAQYFAGR